MAILHSIAQYSSKCTSKFLHFSTCKYYLYSSTFKAKGRGAGVNVKEAIGGFWVIWRFLSAVSYLFNNFICMKCKCWQNNILCSCRDRIATRVEGRGNSFLYGWLQNNWSFNAFGARVLKVLGGEKHLWVF